MWERYHRQEGSGNTNCGVVAAAIGGLEERMGTPEITLAALRNVRTSDVSDALDSMGLQQRYVMHPQMSPSPRERVLSDSQTPSAMNESPRLWNP